MGLERKNFSPDSALPTNPLVQGRGRLPFTSPPLSKKEYPTPEDINRAKTIKGELKEQRGAVSAPVAFGMTGSALVVGGAGGFFLAKEVFANPKTIDIGSFPNSFNPEGSPKLEELPPHLEQPSKPNKVEPIPVEVLQDIKAYFGQTERIVEKGSISKSDIVRLPQEEIDRLFPTAFGKLREDGRTIIRLSQPQPSEAEKAMHPNQTFPDLLFEVGPDKNTLQFQYPIDLRSSSDPDAQIKFTKSYGGFTQIDRNRFQGQGYSDTYTFNDIPKGTIIRAPVDGFLVIDKSDGVPSTDNPNDSAAGFIDFQDPSGTRYRLIIYGEKENSILVLQSLVDAPEFNRKQHKKPVESYGMPVKKGQAIFQTNSKLDEVGFKIMGAIKYKDGERIYVPTNVELIHSPDNQLIVSD